MRKTSRILSLTLALLLITAAILPSAAFAAYNAPSNNNTVTFKTALVVKNDTNIPAAEFEYEITSGVAVTENSLRVIAGPTAQTAPTVTKASFLANADTTDGAAGNSIADADHKYAIADVTVSFANVAFDEPGVYRYKLTQKSIGTDKPYALRSGKSADLTLDVYVQVNDPDDNNLKIAGYVLYDNVITTNAADGGTATGKIGSVNTASTPAATDLGVAYINDMSSSKLSISAAVAGNQGSSDKYFKYTVEISGLTADDKVGVTVPTGSKEPTKSSATAYEAATMTNANNITELTAATGGTITHDFYLKKGDTIEISGLPVGATYKVSAAEEDYTKSGKIGEVAYDGTEKTVDANDVTVTYTFTRTGNVPTGVILTVAPFAVIMLVGIGGAALVLGKRKRTED